MISVTFLCGQALSERALWLLLLVMALIPSLVCFTRGLCTRDAEELRRRAPPFAQHFQEHHRLGEHPQGLDVAACEMSMTRRLRGVRSCRTYQARKRHININFFCPVGLGTTPGLSRGFHRVCPWDKSGENLGQTRVFSLFYTVEARFHRVCPRDKPGLSLGQSRGRRAAQKVYVKKVYVSFFAR